MNSKQRKDTNINMIRLIWSTNYKDNINDKFSLLMHFSDHSDIQRNKYF